MNFTFASFILLITCLSNFGIGVYVFRKSVNKELGKIFSLFCWQLAVWNFTNFLNFTLINPKLILLFSRTALLTILWIPSTYYYFVSRFSNQNLKTKTRTLLFYGPLILLPFIFTQYNLIIPANIIPDGTNSIPGPLYIVYVILFITLIGNGTWRIYKFKNNTTNTIKKSQAAYILFGVFTSGTICITMNAIMPLLGFKFNAYGTALNIIFTFTTAYAITRYRFLDIKLILERNLIEPISMFLSVIVSILFSFAINTWLHGTTTTLFAISLSAVLLAQLIFIWWRKMYLYKSQYYFALPEQFTLTPHCQGYFEGLEQQIQKALHKNFPGATYHLLVLDELEHVFRGVPTATCPTKIMFADDDALVELAKTAKTVITLENLKLTSTNPAITRAVRHFIKKNHIDFIVPLLTNKKMVTGFILISAVSTKKTYTQDQIAKNWDTLSLSFGEYLRQMLTLELLSRPR